MEGKGYYQASLYAAFTCLSLVLIVNIINTNNDDKVKWIENNSRSQKRYAGNNCCTYQWKPKLDCPSKGRTFMVCQWNSLLQVQWFSASVAYLGLLVKNTFHLSWVFACVQSEQVRHLWTEAKTLFRDGGPAHSDPFFLCTVGWREHLYILINRRL